MQQNPMSLIEFQGKFATEKACQYHLFQLRWPERILTAVEQCVQIGIFQMFEIHILNRGRQLNALPDGAFCIQLRCKVCTADQFTGNAGSL